QVMPTRSYLSQSELPVTFGLGMSTKIDDLEIVWPGGQVQKVQPLPPLNKMTVIQQAP
ncbi:MAG: UnbV, partial [Verrucomicrobiales bacterium]|nr:UnbV [Verrucomicrobiales bacterium]